LRGRKHRYLNIEPSRKSLQRERDAILEMTSSEMCYKPVTDMIQRINRQTQGWANYFRYGYPRKSFRRINWYIQCRLINHLNRRSQRPMRPPQGISYYKYLRNLGLIPL
jgi:RNA-directed DNA polymerase